MTSNARQALMEAAMEIFGHFGFKKASIEDIARQAGVGKGSVYLHFESKEALFEAVIRQQSDRDFALLEGLLAAEASPEGKLRVYAQQILTKKLQAHKLGWAHKGLEAAERMIEFVGAGGKAIGELRARSQGVLGDILREGREAGVFHMEDVQMTAEAIHDALVATSARLFINTEQNFQVFHTLAELIVRGLMAAPTTKTT